MYIKKFGSQEAFGGPETQEQVLERYRTYYEMSAEKRGEVSSLTLGSNSSIQLRQSHHTIEACRLFKRLIAISKQQHGQEHKITKDLERGLLQCKTSYVGLSNHGLFEVLRYEGDKYVVRGPYNVAEAGRQTLRVDDADARMQPYGTPVVIHGFGNRAAYLNGKIGDIIV
jgi:hypothetical protein